MINNSWRFNARNFIGFVLVLLLEIGIAMGFHSGIIRSFVGDVLVIVLLFFFVGAFVSIKLLPKVAGIVLFAMLIEIGQYFHLVMKLGGGQNRLALVILGNQFDPWDMLAYLLGGALCWLMERWRIKHDG